VLLLLGEQSSKEARQRCGFSWGEVSFSELLLYNMRHVQDHAAGLNLILGQKIGSAPGWVTRAKSRHTQYTPKQIGKSICLAENE